MKKLMKLKETRLDWIPGIEFEELNARKVLDYIPKNSEGYEARLKEYKKLANRFNWWDENQLAITDYEPDTIYDTQLKDGEHHLCRLDMEVVDEFTIDSMEHEDMHQQEHYELQTLEGAIPMTLFDVVAREDGEMSMVSEEEALAVLNPDF